jgi:aromatic ring-opening dioxygenase catalytic subunit (LigB family)
MAQIVAACATIHSPGLTGWIDQEEEPKRRSILQGMERLRDKLLAARPNLIVAIATDHMLTSPPYNMPDFAIGVAHEHTGPAPGIDLWLRLKPFTIRGHQPLARHLVDEATRLKINFVSHEKVDFDDNFSVPLTYLNPGMRIPFIPVLVNCFVPPQPSPQRCYEAALALKRGIETWGGTERVAVVATGGLSHEPGGPRNFDVDEEFDRWFLGLLSSEAPHAGILRECSIDRMRKAGEGGTTELLAWMMAMAFTEGPAEILAYEATHVWRCGSGMVWWPHLAGCNARQAASAT